MLLYPSAPHAIDTLRNLVQKESTIISLYFRLLNYNLFRHFREKKIQKSKDLADSTRTAKKKRTQKKESLQLLLKQQDRHQVQELLKVQDHLSMMQKKVEKATTS